MTKRSNNKFFEWFDEHEGFAFRNERFYHDVVGSNPEEYRKILPWLIAAFDAGYQARIVQEQLDAEKAKDDTERAGAQSTVGQHDEVSLQTTGKRIKVSDDPSSF